MLYESEGSEDGNYATNTCAHDTNTVMSTLQSQLRGFLLDSMSSLAKLKNIMNHFLGLIKSSSKNCVSCLD